MNTSRVRLIQMLFGLFPVQVMHALAVLGIPDHLGLEPRPVPDLARAAGCDEPALRRLLRAAAGLGLVRHDLDDSVQLTDDGALLRGDAPSSVRNLVLLWGGSEVWRSWGELAHSVRTGGTAYEHVSGQTLFDHLSASPDQDAVFNRAMAETTLAAAAGIAAACDLDGRRLLVDVGGGSGTLIAALLGAHPGLRGILFDRPASMPMARQLLAAAGVLDRCALTGGDFFGTVPQGADTYLLKSVLHDWDRKQCLKILGCCRGAMPDDGLLYVVEPVMPTSDDELAAERGMLISDLNMLVCTGGAERTAAEYRSLLEDSGFRLDAVTRCPAPSNLSVLRARPA